MAMRTTMPIASRRAFVGQGASDEDREDVRAGILLTPTTFR